MSPRLLVGFALAVTLLGLGAAACGARTGLYIPDECHGEGTERACQDGCGSGSQTCSDGLWSQCQVPIATRSCSDGCGTGTESCVDGKWQTCEVGLVQRDCSSSCGAGHETCDHGTWGACDAPQPRPPQLKAIIRDFSPLTHRDFEAAYASGLEVGIVEPFLGGDDKPVYAGPLSGTRTTTGPQVFDQWYHDSPVSLSAPLDLQLLPSNGDAGFFTYSNDQFFPIDNQLLGNEGRSHNFHFTLEASTTFEYRGGEVFSFSGDDDMWVFINRKLAIDLGGLHSRLSAEVSLDTFAPSGGLVRGGVYPLHFFFAERHTVESHFMVRTSIADPGSCD